MKRQHQAWRCVVSKLVEAPGNFLMYYKITLELFNKDTKREQRS
jgi:hypothetical protein